MASLVPYARMVARNPYTTRLGYLGYLRARRAGRTIGRAYRIYRAGRIFRGVKRTVGQLGGLRKKRRTGQRSRVGDTNYDRPAKRNETVFDSGASKNDNTFYNEIITNIGRTTTGEINLRNRDVINLRGFHICMEIKNNLETPLYFNICLVNLRKQEGAFQDDFFRSTSNERAVDFSNVNLNTLDRWCRPINVDKYNVLWRKRILLGPIRDTAAGYSDAKSKSWMTLRKYIKINRQIRYDDGAADSTTDNCELRLIYWYGVFGSTNVVTTAVATQSTRVLVYFREPKC